MSTARSSASSIAEDRPSLRARLARSREILLALTVAEIRQDRQLSLGGITKWILEPLSFMAIYFVVVVTVLRRGDGDPKYLVFLLCSLIPFSYFTGVTAGAMSLAQRYSQALTNRAFPRMLLPPVLILAEGIAFTIALLLLAPFMALARIGPTPALVWLPVVTAVLCVLLIGPAYMFTIFGLYLPDFRGMAQNLLRAGYFLSTGLFKGKIVPGNELPDLIRANPLSGIFDAYRAVVLRGRAPRAIDLLYPLAVGLVLAAVGMGLYRWRAHELPKEV